MTDRSFVLDLAALVRQGLVRPGAFAPGARVAFVDPATGRAWGALSLEVDARHPATARVVLRFVVVTSGERVEQAVRLVPAPPATRGLPLRLACPLCARGALRLHLPGGAARFGCRGCHARSLRRPGGPPAIRPPGP